MALLGPTPAGVWSRNWWGLLGRARQANVIAIMSGEGGRVVKSGVVTASWKRERSEMPEKVKATLPAFS